MPQFDILSWFNQLTAVSFCLFVLYSLAMSSFGPNFIRMMSLRNSYYSFLVSETSSKDIQSSSNSVFFSSKLKYFYTFF